MSKHACTLCGSRDWPRLDTSCPPCHGEPEDDGLWDNLDPEDLDGPEDRYDEPEPETQP